MLMLDIPMFSLQHSPIVLAQSGQSQPVALHVSAAGSSEGKSRTIGVCMPIENSPKPEGMHGSGLSSAAMPVAR
jgi:hypothetical protein